MRANIIGLIFLFATAASAEYKPFFQSIIDGNYQQSLRLASQQIRRAKSSVETKLILQSLISIQDELFSVKDFEDQLIRFKDPSCVKNNGAVNCGEYQGYKFSIAIDDSGEKLQLMKNQKVTFSYSLLPRVGIKNTRIQFGDTVHGIMSIRSPGLSYFIIREIEFHREGGADSIILQTLSFFKMSEGKVCKIGEARATEEDNHYVELVTYLKNLGPLHRCDYSEISF